MISEVERIKRRWEKADNVDLERAITAMHQSPEGRRFLWWLLSIGKVGGQPFNPDPYISAFNAGELNVGNQIQGLLMSVDPEGYTSMQREMLNERNARDAELNAASDADRDASYAGPGTNTAEWRDG